MHATNFAPHRMLVIGLDGASFDLIQPWLRSGKLPNMARIMSGGGGGHLRSVLPVVSPAAWASFSTGVNPGKHGVFDFSQRVSGSYQLRVVTARDIRAPTIWRLLSEAGRRVAIINVPITYPAESVNGVMITGLGTPDSQMFTHPPELSRVLQSQGYRLNKTVLFHPGKEEAFLKDVYDITERVGQTALNVLKQERWDFFMVVFRDSDEMAHFFWKYMDVHHPGHNPQSHGAYRNAILEYYQLLDQWVGKLVEAMGHESNVIIMSDHGCGPLYKDVFLNDWLRQKGLQLASVGFNKHQGGLLGRLGITGANISRTLQQVGLASFERWLRQNLGDKKNLLPAHNRPVYPNVVDWSRTIAYSYGYHGQLFINVKGREPLGIINPEHYLEERARLEHILRAWTDPDDGLPVVSNLLTQEQAFRGPYAVLGADLIVTMRDLSYMTRLGYEFGRKAGQVFSSPSTHESGSHRMDGMLLFSGPDFNTCDSLPLHSIMDLGPTILHLLGLPRPEHMDGTVMIDEIRQELRQVSSVDYHWSDVSDGQDDNVLSREDENNLVERLKGLGYLN